MSNLDELLIRNRYKRAESPVNTYQQAVINKYRKTAEQIAQEQQAEQAHNTGGVLGGAGYLLGKAGLGIAKKAEGWWDYVAGNVANWFGADEWARKQFETSPFQDLDNQLTEWYNPNKTMQRVGTISEGVGGMLPDFAVGAMTGGTGFLPSVMVGSAGQAQSQAVQQTGEMGVKEFLYGTGSGILEGAIEKLSGNIGKAFLGGTMTGNMTKNLARKLTTNKVAQNGLTLLMDAAGEGGEEMLSTVLDPYLRRLTIDPNADPATKEEILESGIIGALTSIAYQGSVGRINAKSNAAKEAAGEIAETTTKMDTEWGLNGNAESQTAQEKLRKQRSFAEEDLQYVLNKLPESRRAEFIQKNGLGAFVNEDGTVKSLSDRVAEPYNPEAYSPSVDVSKLSYKPTSQDLTAEQVQARKENAQLTKGSTKIVFTDDLESGVNGAYKDGVIYISTKVDKPAREIVKHEITHSLEGTKAYHKYADSVLNKMMTDQDFFQEMKRFAESKGFGDDFNTEAALYAETMNGRTATEQTYTVLTELVADYTSEKLFTDPAQIERISRENRGLARRVLDGIRDGISQLRAKKNLTTQQQDTVKFLRSAEKLYRKALTSSVGGVNIGNVSVPDEQKKTAEVKQTAEVQYSLDKSFAQQVDEVIAGTFDKNNSHIKVLNSTPQIYIEKAGMRDLPILISYDKLCISMFSEGKLSDHYHGLGAEIVKQIPNALEDPLLIMESAKPKRIESVVSLKDNKGRDIFAVIEFDSAGRVDGKFIEANILVTAFGAKNQYIEKRKQNNKILYDKKIDLQSQVNLRGQFPNVVNDNKSVSNNSISQTAEKVNSSAEKSAKNDEIRYSLDSQGRELSKEQEERAQKARVSGDVGDIRFSLQFADNISNNQRRFVLNNNVSLSQEELETAIEQTAHMVKLMSAHKDILPEDKVGKTIVKNGSYDLSVENTTICVRTLAYNSFVDMVSEKIGRPLTQMESFLVSQKLYDVAKEPQCLYCYVSLDRKAYNDMILRYIDQRDTAVKAYKSAGCPEITRESKLYKDFLAGRKDTKDAWRRYSDWISTYNNGEQFLSPADVATEAKRAALSRGTASQVAQIKDMLRYAQSASWAKKQTQYVAYYDDILRLNNRVVKDLNKHYGLRWYSFSDYSGAFIVENMQQITDASIRGLKGLAYTKDTDFAKIFAPTGMNINISVYAKKVGDHYEIDPSMSANIDESIALREKYPNVGIVVVATDTAGVEWALAQKWSDVVIPFHTVRTGAQVAEFYNWTVFNEEQNDSIKDQNLWDAYVDSVASGKNDNARKKVSKMVYPSEHQNNKDTYLKIIEERGLKPRFSSFIDNPNYMKLVNETRQSESQTASLKPVYDVGAAEKAFQKFVDKGGYYEGWYNDGIDVESEVEAVASDIRAGKKANEVSYGRQDIDAESVQKSRKSNREHGMRLSISQEAAQAKSDSLAKTQTKSETTKRTVKENADEFNTDFQIKWVDAQAGIVKHGKRMHIEGIEAAAHYARVGEAAATAWVEDRYKDIFQDLKGKGKETDLQEFYNYLLHVHNIDRMAQGKPVFDNVGYMDAVKSGKGDIAALVKKQTEISREIVADYESKHPDYKKRAEKLYAANDEILQMYVDAGMITEKQADGMREMYRHYVPTYRDMEAQIGTGSLKGVYNYEVKNTIKGAKGSDAEILPIDVMLGRHAITAVKAVRVNELAKKLYYGAKKSGVWSGIREVYEPQKATAEDIANIADIPAANNEITFYDKGKKITMRVSDDIFEGFSAFAPGKVGTDNKVVKLVTKFNTLFKKLTTGYNPFFLVRNGLRDIQDAALYSKRPALFAKYYAEAVKEMGGKGEIWREYRLAGGLASSVFDYNDGITAKSRNPFKKVLNKIESINQFIEQIPRFTEYYASRKAGDNVETALWNSAEVTVDFSRAGTMAKKLNSSLIPFLNPAIQGWSKLWRTVTGKKTIGEWVSLVARAAMFGIMPAMLNELLLDDDDEYNDLNDRDKDNNYLFKLGNGQFLKLPKGRVVSVLGSVALRSKRAAQGQENAFDGFVENAVSQLTPIDAASRTIFSPIYDAQTNTTWYGGNIESQSDQSVAPKQRYDESTSKIAVVLGNALNYSPKKIHYIIDQYSGIIGDLILPATTPKSERNVVSYNFVIDSKTQNKISTQFYDAKQQATWAKNAGDKYAAAEVRYYGKIQSDINKLYSQKREIQSDTTLSRSEKLKQAQAIQVLINTAQKQAMAEWNTLRNELERGGYELTDDSMADDFRTATRNAFGAERAIREYNETTYAKSSAMNAVGIDWDDIYDTYFNVRAIEPDYDGDEMVSGSRKTKIMQIINTMPGTKYQKLLLAGMCGYTSTANAETLERWIKSKRLTVEQELYLRKIAGLEVKKWIKRQNLTGEEKEKLYEIAGVK